MDNSKVPLGIQWVVLLFTQNAPSSQVLEQSGRSPKVVALFSATNFSSYIIELFQLHATVQI